MLEDITRLVNIKAWELLKGEAERKLETQESTVNRLIFRTRSPVEPLEIEYFRGFRQGVKYVLDALPNEIQAELKKARAETERT